MVIFVTCVICLKRPYLYRYKKNIKTKKDVEIVDIDEHNDIEIIESEENKARSPVFLGKWQIQPRR